MNSIHELPEEVKQAIKEELMKFVGKPIDNMTRIEMTEIVTALLNFYDIPWHPTVGITGRKISLKFFLKRPK